VQKLVNKSRNRPQVIVRSWGDQPVILFLYRVENNRCFVGSENTRRPIGLPEDQVFVFDKTRFAQLSTAYRSGNKAKLRAVYDLFGVDDFACNRYQDKLESSHDKENIADSERIAGGNTQ
jgi:hypothetical protein